MLCTVQVTCSPCILGSEHTAENPTRALGLDSYRARSGSGSRSFLALLLKGDAELGPEGKPALSLSRLLHSADISSRKKQCGQDWTLEQKCMEEAAENSHFFQLRGTEL